MVFCIIGKPNIVRVDTDRFTKHKMDFFDCNWERIPNAGMGYPISGRKIEKPECLAELLEYARKLSKPFIHARVDFYIVKDKIYFGEITFTSLGGMMDFYTPEFLMKMGGMVDLNYSM